MKFSSIIRFTFQINAEDDTIRWQCRLLQVTLLVVVALGGGLFLVQGNPGGTVATIAAGLALFLLLRFGRLSIAIRLTALLSLAAAVVHFLTASPPFLSLPYLLLVALILVARYDRWPSTLGFLALYGVVLGLLLDRNGGSALIFGAAAVAVTAGGWLANLAQTPPEGSAFGQWLHKGSSAPRVDETRALAKLVTLLTTLDAQEIYRRGARAIAENITVAYITISSWQADEDRLVVQVEARPSASANVTVTPHVTAQAIELAQRPETRQVLQTQQSRLQKRRDSGVASKAAPVANDWNCLLEVPLVTGGEATGLISLFRRHDQPEFTHDDLLLAEIMASQIAIALNKATIASEARARAAQLNTLNRFSRILAQTRNLRQMYIDARREVLPLFDATGMSIALVDSTGRNLNWVYGYEYGKEVDLAAIGPQPIDTGFSGRVIRDGRPLLLSEGLDQIGDALGSFIVGVNAAAWLGIPLVVATKTIGVLSIENGDDPGAFDSHDIELLSTIAGPLAVSINNLLQFEQTEAALKEQSRQSLLLRTAAEVSAAVGSVLDIGELALRVVELMQQRFDLYHVSFFMVEPVSGEAKLVAASGTVEEQQRRAGLSLPIGGRSLVGQAISMGKIQLATDVDNHPMYRPDPLLPDARSQLVVPLRSRNRTIGAINLYSRSPSAFSDQGVTVVQTLSDQIAVAIENAGLFAQVQESLVRLNNLYQSGRKITQAEQAQTVYESIVGFAASTGLIDQAQVITADPSSPNDLIFPAFWNRDDKPFDQEKRIPQAVFPYSSELTENRLIVIPDRHLEERPGAVAGVQLADPELRALMLVPIHREAQWLGTLALLRYEAVPLAASELQPFLTLCDQAATVLSNQLLLEETNTLYRASRSLSQVITLEDALNITVNEIARHTAADQCRIILYDMQLGLGRIAAEYVESGLADHMQFPMSGDWVYESLRVNRQPILLDDSGADDITVASYLHPFNTKQSLLVPAISQQELIGFLALDLHSNRRAFTESSANFVQTLVDQLNTQLENLDLFDEALTRAQEMVTLNQIGTLISGTLDINALAAIVYEQVGRLLDNSIFILATFDDTTKIYRPLFAARYGEAFAAEPSVLAEDDPLYRFLQNGNLVASNRDEALCRQAGPPELYVSGWVPESALWMPMQHEGVPTGLLSVQSYRPRGYNDNHVQLLRTIANQTGLALANARLFQQTQEALFEIRSLFELTQAVAASPQPERRLERVAETLHTVFQDANVTIFTLADTGDTLERVAAAGAFLYPDRLALRDGLLTRAVREATPQLSNHLTDQDVVSSDLIMSQLAIPLTFGQRTIGVLLVESESPDAFGDSDVRLLQTLSVSLAATIESGRLFQEIQLANEQLRELDSLKTQFLANMSHELRTPLNSIIGFSRVILKGIDGPITDQQAQDLGAIYNSGRHLLALINDLLDVARIEAGELALVTERVNVGELAQRLLGTLRGIVRDKEVELIAAVEQDLPEVEADPVRLRQIFLNVLSNAAKFTEKGYIKLTVTRQAENEIYIGVTDTGIGIAPDDIERIFEAFVQAEYGLKGNREGTGLGLPIAKRLVLMHHGTITLESELQKGTTFHITLPIDQPADAVTRQKQQLAALAQTNGRALQGEGATPEQ